MLVKKYREKSKIIGINNMFKKGELKVHKWKKPQKMFVFSLFFLQINHKKRQYYDVFHDIYDTLIFESLFLIKLLCNKNIF